MKVSRTDHITHMFTEFLMNNEIGIEEALAALRLEVDTLREIHGDCDDKLLAKTFGDLCSAQLKLQRALKKIDLDD